MKATKKLLMIGLMLLVLTGLTVFFSISASAADITDDGSLVVFNDKVYDGTTNVTVDVGATLANFKAKDDTITSVNVVASFENKNVGTDKAITYNVTITGADGETYNYTGATYTADITPAVLTPYVESVEDKTYDGTTAANVVIGFKDNDGNKVACESSYTAAWISKNAGTSKINVTDITIADTNYVLSADALQGVDAGKAIAKRNIVVSGITAEGKVYDGKHDVVVNVANVEFKDMVVGDDIGFDFYMARFASANVGTVEVVFDTAVLTGADKNNYAFTVEAVKAEISSKTIYLTSVALSSKVYDGDVAVNPAATVLSYMFDGRIGDDVVTLVAADLSGVTYTSKNVFAGEQALNGITAAAFELGGAAAGNYKLAIADGCKATSTITKATITINSAVISDKVYDGTLNVAANATITVVADGVFGTDTVLYSIAAGNDIAYEDINVNGQAIQSLKNLTADDIVLGGADAGNYDVAIATDCTVKSAITPRGITISGITAKNKDYDGTAENITFVYEKVATDFLVGADEVGVVVTKYTIENGGNAGHTAVIFDALELTGAHKDNYYINIGSQSKCEIDIYKLNVVINIGDKTIKYGDPAKLDTVESDITVTPSGRIEISGATYATLPTITYTLATNYVDAAGDPNRVVGNYYITVKYADAEAERVATNYNVTVNNGTLTVEKRTLTVDPGNATIVYGNAFTTENITVALDNWVYGEDATTVTINGEYVITTAYENVAGSANRVVGTYGYNLTASTLEADNYDFDYTATAELTVTKKAVTVSVDPTVITYGDAVPEYVIKFVGWVYDEGTVAGSDLISYDSKLGVSVSNAYKQGDDAGAYPYTFNGKYYALQNYEFVYQAGELTVNKRQVTVTANDMALIYGESIDTTKYGYTYDETIFYGDDVIGEVTFTCDYVAGNNIGTYTIVPSIEDTTNYDYTCVNGTLTVSPKSITLTVKDHTIEYRADAANAGFDGQDQILAKDVDSFAFKFTYGDYTVGSAVGTYPISLAYTANANYTVTVVDGTLTVVTRKITVTPAHGNLVYGAEIPADGYTYDWNFKDMLTADNVTFGGTAAYATTYTQGATAKDTYVITVSDLTLEGDKYANYEIVYANGTQTVNKAALTINISAEISYGDELPEKYTVEDEGFVLNETLENLGGELVITVPTYTKGNDVGEYAIVAEGYTSDNYEITYNAANKLTVKKIIIKGTVDTPANIEYGAAEPAFTITFDLSVLVNGDTAIETLKGYVEGKIDSGYDVADAAKRGIGEYTITATDFEATNYTFEITGATLTVVPKAITLNVKDYTDAIIYGNAFPIDTINSTYVELVDCTLAYGEDYATGGIVFVFTTDYVAGNDTDVYTFVATASATNYAITWNNNNGEFTVSPKTLSFTIDEITNVIYGNQPNYSGVIKWTEADFIIGDTAEDLVGSITVRATGYGAGSPVGEYAITVKINLDKNGNYILAGDTFDYENKTSAKLVVSKRNIHISANNAEIEYYSAAPVFGYTVSGSGIAPNDTLADVFGKVKFTCTYGIGASVGNYTIVVTTEKTSDNYDLVLEHGTLKVTPKTIYIMPDADSKFAGEADPTFTFTYSGNIAGETPKFTGKLTRVEGETARLYNFACNELGLADNAPFYAENYQLALDPNAPQFEIFGTDSENAINVKLEGAGVDLLDEIHLYYVFSINNPNGLEIAEMGLLQWTADEYAALASYGYDAKYAFTNGYDDGGYYFYNGQSIDATKYMDTYYARAYVKLANGEYVYSKVMSYSVTDYAKTILGSEIAEHIEARPVVIAMLDYGTAVMKFRGMTDAGYPSDIVSSANRTAYGKVYEDTLKVNAIIPGKTVVDETKLSDRLSFHGISTTLYGAIDVNFNSNIVELAEGETIGMYYWTEEQYNAAEGNLTVIADQYEECIREANQYTVSIKNIAAKDAKEIYYAVLVIRDAEGNDVEYSRTVAGSAEIYASIAVDYFNGQNVEAVAKAMLVYINEAAKYAAN